MARQHVDLHAEVIGSGPPVVVVHGGLGIDHRYLRPWLDPLARNNTLMYADLRGHGASSGADMLAESTHADLCDDLERLRQSRAITRMTLFGHSYGGFLALEYALRFPQHVAGLVLCATSASLAHAAVAMENAKARASSDSYAALQEIFSAPVGSDARLRELWHLITPIYFSARAADPARHFATTTFTAAGYNRAAFGLLPTYDVRSRLHEIDVPTLVVSGSDDWLMPPSLAGDQLASSMPNAQHVVLDGAGHYPFIEENDAFVAATSPWLREVA